MTSYKATLYSKIKVLTSKMNQSKSLLFMILHHQTEIHRTIQFIYSILMRHVLLVKTLRLIEL